MNSVKYFRILKKLGAELGDENLTISMAYSNSEYFVSVSTHTSSKFEFDHGGYQRTVQITDNDLSMDSEKLLKELVNIYRYLLKTKKTENADVAERNKTKLQTSSN